MKEDDGIRSRCVLKDCEWGECCCKTQVSEDDAFEYGDFIITDPYSSVCGRFFVDPLVYYGTDYITWMMGRMTK